jgi:hypothetical protein
MANVINGTSTGSGGLITTGDDSGILNIQTNETTAITVDASQNVGIGTSSPASDARLTLASPTTESYVMFSRTNSGVFDVAIGNNGGSLVFKGGADSATVAGLTEFMRLDSSGNLAVSSTSNSDGRIKVDATTGTSIACAVWAKNSAGSASGTYVCWNAATTGNNGFMDFYTETVSAFRGSITYNRAGGLVAYNTTSDYRAKDISGPVTGSGALIDSIPVYMGKMKGATQERPMFIAHETPAYAHTGEKDAVDADGNPVYQQMDASALIPVMWAEIQSLRQRITALEGA